MGIFSKKSISTEAAQQPQPKNNAMADAMPQDASQQVPVAATPQMQAPLQRPVSAAPQPQPQQATAPDAAVAAPQPQQAAAPVGQMQMPTGEPYMNRASVIQPGNSASVLQDVTPQAQAPIVPQTDEEAYIAYRQTLPDNLRYTKDADYEDGGDYRSRRYWELHGKPKDFNEGLSKNMFTKEDDGLYHSTSVAYNKDKDEYEFMKSPKHPTVNKELEWYYSNEDGAPEFRKKYELDKSGKYYKYVNRNAKKGVSVYTPEIPEPSQEQLQTQALERLQPSYWQKYGNYNWDSNGGDFWKNAKESGLSLRDAINYYNKWQEDNNGKPLDMFEQYALLKRYDPFRSMKEQDEEDERLKRQQKWEKISNLFNHLANLYGTVRGANPAQQIESGTDLTKRQQEAVDRVRALRKAAGQDYIDALAAKRADEFKQMDLKHKADALKEQQRGNDLRDAYDRDALALRGEIAKLQNELKQAELERRKQADANREKHENAKDKARATQAGAAATRANIQKSKYNDSKNYTEVVEENANTTGTRKTKIKTKVPNKSNDAQRNIRSAQKNANMSKLNIKGAAKRKQPK